MRILVVAVTAVVVGLGAAVPGASAQTGFTGFQASSTGLISEEGFVNLGTTFECAVATNGALVCATLEQRHAGGTSTAFAFGGRLAYGALCAPGGSPLALGFGAPEGLPFKPGRAVLSAEACVATECKTVQQTVKLRDGGRTLEAPLPPGGQSVGSFWRAVEGRAREQRRRDRRDRHRLRFGERPVVLRHLGAAPGEEDRHRDSERLPPRRLRGALAAPGVVHARRWQRAVQAGSRDDLAHRVCGARRGFRVRDGERAHQARPGQVVLARSTTSPTAQLQRVDRGLGYAYGTRWFGDGGARSDRWSSRRTTPRHGPAVTGRRRPSRT
jgi:hypothetical protein